VPCSDSCCDHLNTGAYASLPCKFETSLGSSSSRRPNKGAITGAPSSIAVSADRSGTTRSSSEIFSSRRLRSVLNVATLAPARFPTGACRDPACSAERGLSPSGSFPVKRERRFCSQQVSYSALVKYAPCALTGQCPGARRGLGRILAAAAISWSYFFGQELQFRRPWGFFHYGHFVSPSRKSRRADQCREW